MVIAHATTGFWHHLQPCLETVSYFDNPNHRQIKKMSPAPRIHPRIDKNGHLDLKVPVGCPCGTLDHLNGQWSLKVSKLTASGIKMTHFSNQPVKQLPADRGAGGKGEALRSMYIYIYI